MVVGEGVQCFLWNAVEEPGEFLKRVGLFTWRQLMVVQQTPCLAVPVCVGMRPGGVFRWMSF